MAENEKHSTKVYLVAAGIGAGSYLVLTNLLGDSKAEHARFESALNNIVEHEQTQQGQINRLEQKLSENTDAVTQINRQIALAYGQNQGNSNSPNGFPLQTSPQEVPYPTNTGPQYPTHDIYFSWEANDKGVDHSKREYRLSLNTGKFTENAMKVGSWFKSLFQK